MPDSNGVFHVQFVGDERATIDQLVQLGQVHVVSGIQLHGLPELSSHVANTNGYYRSKDLIVLLTDGASVSEVMQNYHEAKRVTPNEVQIIVVAAAIGEDESERPVTEVKDKLENEGAVFFGRDVGVNAFPFNIEDHMQSAQLRNYIEQACSKSLQAQQFNPQEARLHAMQEEGKHPHLQRFKRRVGGFMHRSSQAPAQFNSL